MPTSVHIPRPLLAALDRRARTLKVSRNRVIVRALERELTQGTQWSPDFFAELGVPEPGIGVAADEMLKAIRKHRQSKKPVRL
ncbi:MAG TPA: ribbon-helix-helix domain-containing protein [Polyangiaceae bacterium]|nr:ribbon-helix-helix domain-containing protein [Polyangiaceae bacterium]